MRPQLDKMLTLAIGPWLKSRAFGTRKTTSEKWWITTYILDSWPVLGTNKIL